MPVELYSATVNSATTIENIISQLIPVINLDEIKTWHDDCNCRVFKNTVSKCVKMGPLALIRFQAEQGEHLPKIEDNQLIIGQQFPLQARNYEIHCLIVANRLDPTGQLLILHSTQPGMITMYDHNNGLRIVEAERVSSKLFIIGLLVLPTRSPKAILTTKELMSAAGALETARYPKKQLKVVKGILKSPKKRRNVVNRVSRSTNNNAKASRSDKKTLPQILKRKQNDRESDPINDPDPDGLPKTLSLHAEGPKLGVISMFDGVGSVYRIIKKKIGRAPTVYIAAETDPVLRRLVAAELGLREDQQWGYTAEGATTIYVKDVWKLLDNDSLILRQAKAMYPDIKWLLIAGSPCQDLTFAGYLNGLLGLTGKRSMLFFVVYIVLYHLQALFGYEAVRFLTENAGSMQVVQRNLNSKTGQQLDQSEHYQMFIHCLGLPPNIPAQHWIWDASTFYGVRRKRVFFRSHLDTATPAMSPPLAMKNGAL